ncbi:hypothetical protein, partial [Aminivibrio sp.]|uniref:hypothetical protein n=1 Tax=Aminivibrio sp. TaxID=1872489 RepID=UPI0025B7DF58
PPPVPRNRCCGDAVQVSMTYYVKKGRTHVSFSSEITKVSFSSEDGVYFPSLSESCPQAVFAACRNGGKINLCTTVGKLWITRQTRSRKWIKICVTDGEFCNNFVKVHSIRIFTYPQK